MVDTRPVTCSGCGAERSPKVASTIPRPPCPECGETAVKWEVTSASAMTMSSSVMASLAPGEQERDWKRRWQDAQQHLARLLAPRTEPLSSSVIHAAHADLQAFYTQTYHLKDSLKKASSTIGVCGQTIENAVTNDPDLALLADLANLDKHGKLSKPPRSGHVPKIERVTGTTGDYQTSGGWRLDVVIEHRGRRLDGLDVAKRALSAWERALKRWNLS